MFVDKGWVGVASCKTPVLRASLPNLQALSEDHNMGSDKGVREIIGPKNVDFILEEVDDGTIDSQKMWDFADKLGPTIGGNHKRRVEKRPSDQAEMRRILSDWYEEELYDMNQAEAVLVLADIFAHDDIKLFPLAHELRNGVKIDEATKTKHRHRKAQQQPGTIPSYNNEGVNNMFNNSEFKNSPIQQGDTYSSGLNPGTTSGSNYNNKGMHNMFNNSKFENSKIQQGDNHTTNNITTADENTRGAKLTPNTGKSQASTVPPTTGVIPEGFNNSNIQGLSVHQGNVYKTENKTENKTVVAADNKITKNNVNNNNKSNTRTQQQGPGNRTTAEAPASIRFRTTLTSTLQKLLKLR